MKSQVEGIRTIIGGLDAWLSEIQSAPDHRIVFEDGTSVTIDNSAVSDAEARVHGHIAVETMHPYPRCIVSNNTWNYDANISGCKVEAILVVSFELIRANISDIGSADAYNAMTPAQQAAVTTQYLDVCESLSDIMTAFSSATYGTDGENFAQGAVNLIQGPWISPGSEVPIEDLNGESLVHWWADFRVVAQTS